MMYTNQELRQYEGKPVALSSEKREVIGKLIKNPHNQRRFPNGPVYAVAFIDEETSKPRFIEIEPDMIYEILDEEVVHIEMMSNRFCQGFKHLPELEEKITKILAENQISC